MDDSYPSPRRAVGLGVLSLILTVVVVGALMIGLWAFGVFTSDIKGRGDLVKTNNSAVNRIEKQEMFEQLYADINGYTGKIDVAREQVKADPSDSIAQTNLAGVRQQCIDTVQQYNAEARKVTSRDWRSADLPEQELNQEDYCA